MAIKFGDRIVNINPDYAVIDLSDNQSRGVHFFPNGMDETNLTDVPADKRVAGMLGVDVANDKVFLFTGTQAQADDLSLFDIAPIDGDGNPVNQQAPNGTASGGTYWQEIGTVERRFTDLPVAIADNKTFGKYTNAYNHPVHTSYTGVIPITQIGAGQGMTALEIIVEALSEAQPIPVELDVYDDTYAGTTGQNVYDSPNAANPSGTFPFGVQSGNVGWSIEATNINENLVDDQGDNITLDTAGSSATCKIEYRTRGSANDWTTFVANVNLVSSGGNLFTASGSTPWSTALEYDDFVGFEFRAIVTDTLGMQGEDIDSIGVSDYSPPHVAFTASRIDNTSATYLTNETDGHRMPGNVNSALSWTITPQLQDNAPGTVIQVTGYTVYRKTFTAAEYEGTHPMTSAFFESETGWTSVTSATGLSLNTNVESSAFTYNDTSVPHEAVFVAYKIVVQDDFLDTALDAYNYYNSNEMPYGSSPLSGSPLDWPGTQIGYMAAFATPSGYSAGCELKPPMFFFNANIAGATLAGGGTANNLVSLTGFPTALPATFEVTFGDDTLSDWSGAVFSALGDHHGNSKQLPVNNESIGPNHGFPTTFANYSSGNSNGYRLVMAIPEPYGGTPSEITDFVTNLNSFNQMGAFFSALVDIKLPTGPENGGDQVDPLPTYQYRIYVSANADAFGGTQTVTITYS